MTNRNLSVAGIISGIGNIYGFYQAGFKPLFILDNRRFIKQGIDTVINNMPGCAFSKNTEAFSITKPTVIVSSPSCAQVTPTVSGTSREITGPAGAGLGMAHIAPGKRAGHARESPHGTNIAC